MMSALGQLSPDSTLRVLPVYTIALDSQQPLFTIASAFERDPDLPGILVTQGSRFVGVVSRHSFQIERSWATQPPLVATPTIADLLTLRTLKPLQLPDTCKIEAAVRMLLKRPAEELAEPIVLERRDLSIALLDAKVLLMAHAQILMAANQVIQQQRLIIKEYHAKLEVEQKRVASQVEVITQQKAEISQNKKAFEIHKLETLNQSRQFVQIQRCLQTMSQALAQGNVHGLEMALEGVQAICNNIVAITETGHALNLELDSFQENSRTIEKISQQVQHLAVQATVAANQSTEQMGSFGRITTDISKFAVQLLDVGQRLEQFVYRFKTRIQDLTQVAQRGTHAARALVMTVETSEETWYRLDTVIQDHNATQPDTHQLQRPLQQDVAIGFLAQDLKHRIDKAEQALNQLARRVSQTQTEPPLVAKLGRTLDVARANGLSPLASSAEVTGSASSSVPTRSPLPASPPEEANRRSPHDREMPTQPPGLA